jgi:HlyD family secretion protein
VKRAVLILLVLGAVGGSVVGYYRYRAGAPAPVVTTAPIGRGSVVETVGATGTLQAVTTVQVGTQVSGTIQNLYADFNSLVRKGQVLARLDPSLFQTQIEQARANLIRAQAELERLRVSLDDARQKLARAQELSSRSLIPQTDLETAQVNARSVEAQIRSAEAQVTQAQASLNQNDVNLQHTVIEAPIDGLVISRNVDVGQTVAASMQAPTLFILAADLTKMQVVANLDESDVGRIRPGQPVSFRVDAYPAEDFSGSVSQVRLQPIVQQNVVTYATVIDVPNPQLKLKPGMTANVNIEIARRDDVLRIPNAALRFRPTNEIYAALGQPLPDPEQLGAAAGGSARVGRGAPSPAPPSPTAAGGEPLRAAAPASKEGSPETRASDSSAGRSGTGSGPAPVGRGGRNGAQSGVAGRLQDLSPEQRAQRFARLSRAGNGGAPRAPGRAGPPADGADGADSAQEGLVARKPGATTFDALFGPLPTVESVGRVWLFVNKQLTPVRVRTGISDGQASELIEGEVQEGLELVTNIAIGTTVTRATTTNPLFGQPRGFQGGGGGGNNRGGARGR